jgi:antitoxin component YwqK of YwqJK toxin-antitoxin module
MTAREQLDHGLPWGTIERWNKKGVVHAIHLANGNGLWTDLDDNEKPVAEGRMASGLKEGPWFEPEVDMTASGTYAAGDRIGAWTFKDAAGTKRREGFFLAGRQNGAWQYWDEDGGLVAKGRFANGNVDGAWTLYLRGDVTQRLVFKADKLVMVDGRRATKQYQNGFLRSLFVAEPSMIEPMNAPAAIDL